MHGHTASKEFINTQNLTSHFIESYEFRSVRVKQLINRLVTRICDAIDPQSNGDIVNKLGTLQVDDNEQSAVIDKTP
jgi:hypothetical protein